MAYTKDEPITLDSVFRVSGTKTDPSQPVTIQIKHLPSGTTEEDQMTKVGTGEFEYEYTPNEVGKYLWQVETANNFKEMNSFVVESDQIEP